MSPSPTDRPSPSDGTVPLRDLLVALSRAWDRALEAAASSDLDGCSELLDAADHLLAAAPAAIPGPDDESARQDALAAHARLHAVLQGSRDEVEQEMGRLRQGRRALHGYGGERATGETVKVDA